MRVAHLSPAAGQSREKIVALTLKTSYLFLWIRLTHVSWLSTRHAFHCTLWWKKSQSSGWQQECRHSHIYNYNSRKCHNKIWIKYDEMIKWYTWWSDPHGDYPRISKLTSACLEHALHGLANSECQRHVQLNNKLMCLFTKSNLKILSQASFVLHGSTTKQKHWASVNFRKTKL